MKHFVRFNPRNPCLMADGYKFSHAAAGAVHKWGQYPPHTERQFSYIEARVGSKFSEGVFFGLQYFLKEYMTVRITKKDVEEAEYFCKLYGVPFDTEKFMDIVNRTDGYWDVTIEAIPEGSVVPKSNVQVQIYNNSPESFWQPSFLETVLQRAVWYGSTVATLSREAKKVIRRGLEISADNLDGLPWKLHDFGARGVSCHEQAMIGGAAHLVNFMGSDTVEGVVMANYYYGEQMAANTIVATEHSTTISWGEIREPDALINLIDQFGDKYKIIASVADSFDFFRVVEEYWGERLLQRVKDWGGTIVVRPDSGDATTIPVEGIDRLMKKVGHTLNTKRFRLLPNYFRFVQGDGMNLESVEQLDNNLIAAGISTDNLTRGMGGGLLMKVDRDTMHYAQKPGLIEIRNPDGTIEYREIRKTPKTDTGKTSKGGRLALIESCGIGSSTIETIKYDDLNGRRNLLRPVWKTGELLIDSTFAQVRENAKLDYHYAA